MTLINAHTKKWLDAFLRRPSQSLLIDTNYDLESGLEICAHIHEKLIADTSNPMIILEVDDQTTSIGIQEIRSFQKNLRLKANKTETTISRIAVIPRGELLTTEAQNALLKLIEEPPASTVIILITTHRGALLPTILSRCIQLPVLPLQHSDAIAYAQSIGMSEQDAEQALLLSDGRAGVFKIIVSNKTSELSEKIKQAKQFIAMSVFERLKNQDIFLAEKQFQPLLPALRLIAKTGLQRASSLHVKKQWKHKLTIILETERLLEANGSAKLLYLRLCVLL